MIQQFMQHKRMHDNGTPRKGERKKKGTHHRATHGGTCNKDTHYKGTQHGATHHEGTQTYTSVELHIVNALVPHKPMLIIGTHAKGTKKKATYRTAKHNKGTPNKRTHNKRPP